MNKQTIYRKPMGESLFEAEFTVEALASGKLVSEAKDTNCGLDFYYSGHKNRNFYVSLHPIKGDKGLTLVLH